MTQHIMQEHTEEDLRTWRRLSTVIACFMLATIAMAVAVTLAVG